MSDTSPINSDRLLQRFLKYVRVGTPANPDSDAYPSSDSQLELGKLLIAELESMGAEQVEHDEHGLVWATIPATIDANVPTILLNAHLDTSPEAPAVNVQPQVIEDYAGGDIDLPTEGAVIRVADCPALEGLVGHRLVTTDGSTLLGGDDKAGVAAIMELANHLLENPGLPHGELRVLFTCDEEIGRGAQHFDLAKADATAGYTLDGGGAGMIENENFSADQLVVTAIGHNIHPAIAKDRMVNAARAIAALINSLPLDDHAPETTDGREGFLHPYHVEGGVGQASCKILLRDFDTEKLDEYEQLVRDATERITESMKGIQFNVERTRQYRNMADHMRQKPQVVELAQLAHEQLGRSCELGSIRGGTDGAMFSEMGLPTPNLSVGQHNIHSVLEFASITEMTAAIEHLVQLLDNWQSHCRS